MRGVVERGVGMWGGGFWSDFRVCLDSPEKFKASEGVQVYCRDTVWRGVIRKAGSRAGKFKDHEEGKVSVCTNKILLCTKCFQGTVAEVSMISVPDSQNI